MKIMPHVLFTAHMHKSMIISMDPLTRDVRPVNRVKPSTPIQTLTLGVSDLYEIIVPTCSYRMGVKDMGYGLAVIGNNLFQLIPLNCFFLFDIFQKKTCSGTRSSGRPNVSPNSSPTWQSFFS